MTRLRRCAPALLTCALTALAGCSAQSAQVAAPSSAPSGAASAAAFTPMEVRACDRTFTLKKAPQRVVIVNAVGIPDLAALGLLDRVVARAGTLDSSLFGAHKKTIDAIPVLTSQAAGGGQADVSVESILEKKPDLVIGSIKLQSISAKLAEAGVASYIPQPLCGAGGTQKASLGEVYDEVARVGAMFGAKDKAAAAVEELKKRADTGSSPTSRGTAVAVYVTPGETQLWGYGTSSQITPQLEAVGLRNALGDVKERNFKVSFEKILELNPDYIVIVHQENGEAARKSFLATAGAADLKAVKNNHVVTQPFALTDPPSPLTIDGLDHLRGVIK